MERFYQQYYQRQYNKIHHLQCPRVLGIDEHAFAKKQGYVTTLCDLRKHKVFDIVQGHSSKTLKSYFDTLQGKDKVQVGCMDLSSTYKALVRHHFPNAKIVADRFHVIRLLNHMCMKTYHQIDPAIKYQRGILKLLRTKPNNLSPQQLIRLNLYLSQQPAIEAIYLFQQKLYRLMMKKHRTAKQCQKLIRFFLEMIKQLK